MAGEITRTTHWLLRAIAVFVGVVFVLFGGLCVAACTGLIGPGPNAPAAAKVGATVQIVATIIFALVALFGAFLIWVGLRRGAQPVEAVSASGPVEMLLAEMPVEASVPSTSVPRAISTSFEASPIRTTEPFQEVRTEQPAQPVRHFAPGELGQFIASCGPEKSGQLNNYLWGGALLVFAVLCAAAPGNFLDVKPGDETMIRGISLGAAGLSLAFALGIVWSSLWGAPQVIELYENGIVERSGDNVRRIEFAAIKHLRLQEWYEHRFAERTFNVKAHVHGQRQLTFSSNLRGQAEQIIEYLASHIPQTEFVEFNATM